MTPRAIVEVLAADEMDGRDNQTAGSDAAQAFLVDQLQQFAEPGAGGYLQVYDDGTNIVGIVPGGELADEYVLIGAHYDHLGNECRGVSSADDICNGAADNAAGVAAALTIARSIAAEGTPRRSLVVAFWDGEEDGLVGARHYASDPVVPLGQTVIYVNFDILGTNLLPSLRDTTVVIGEETGGSSLVDVVSRAVDESTLDVVRLSLLFGQSRSDHAVFANADVPSVFFTDANSGCYHTVSDDASAIDFGKLDRQIAVAKALTGELLFTDEPPVGGDGGPLTSFRDAIEFHRILSTAAADFSLFGSDQHTSFEKVQHELDLIVDAGEESFDRSSVAIVLGGAAELIEALAGLPCDPYLG